jgi:tRNA threonylcarbamoyladenosine modification (KEOPS) complex  Pcc1 subunit
MTTRRATIALGGPEADIVRGALAPEAGRDVPKTRVRVGGRGRRLILTITSDDTGSLRAAVNSYLRWADLAARASEAAHR